MKTYCIATANDRFAKLWKNTEVTFDELINRLKTTTVTPETMGEFRNLPKSKQDNIKDVGGFVGGRLKNGIRRRDKVECRSLLTLDADYATPDFCESIDLFANYSYIIYSTHKHTTEKPRLRLVIPLSRNCTAEEYEAVARKIADEIGIDQFDDTTYQPQRLMYWSSTSIDGEYVFKYSVRNPIDVDGVLARYNDWHDVDEWQFSSRTVKQKDRLLKKQEDPTTKKGVIGAFCRCYDIHTAIAEFLPDVYVKCSADDRYTYANGSTASGLVVYEDGKFAYSNHATDPAGGQLCNAFDLVRTMMQSREHLHQNYPHTLLCRNLRQIIRRSDCCCTKKESSPACRILRVISKARTTMTGCLNWQRTARATTCRQLTTV